MPTIEENKKVWGSESNWEDHGESWSATFGSTDALWNFIIYPRITNHLYGDVLEIGCGHGRISTRFTWENLSKIVLTDLNENCVDYCKTKFKYDENVEVKQINGLDLSQFESGSFDFVFSYDVLVHCDKYILDSYLLEISRILREDGAAFIHYSNMGMYSGGNRDIAFRAKDTWYEQVDNRVKGLLYPTHELLKWDNGLYVDCFTMLTKYEREYFLYQNDFFAKGVKELAKVYEDS